MRKSLWFLVVGVFITAGACTMNPSDDSVSVMDGMDGEPADTAAWETSVTEDFNAVLAALGTDGAASAMAWYDAKYDTDLSSEFSDDLGTQARFAGGSSSYPPLTDLPFSLDGSVYLSGGSTDLVGSVIGWVAPKNLPGGYFHGASLDIDKVDPNNADMPCLLTAIPKGAGYETVNEWRGKVNVCVLNPNAALTKSRLDSAQLALDYYCKPSNTNQEYGFFKNYVNIFNVVSKSDTYTWYCTKVVWSIFNKYGIEIDSNSTAVDFTKSGLYSLVKTYYKTIYFYSSSKANSAINAYIADARSKIVLAEEIMLSPNLTKVYEKIRE
jgi:hypothetical protein